MWEFSIDENEPLYPISVVSKLIDLPEWTLRILDREGIVSPQRTKGGTRRYSTKDIKKLKFVAHLLKEEKVNINGIKIIIEMRGDL